MAVLSGANVNFDRLRFVAERAELGEQREAVFAATIPERPGSFKRFCRLVGKRSVTEFNYRYDDPQRAHVFVGVEVRDRGRRPGCSRRSSGTGSRRSTSPTTRRRSCTSGISSVVAPPPSDEQLYRFEFPERPGALMEFLDSLAETWNISLFHYRNHGADHGRVLAGIQVPPSERRAFRDSLRRLGYAYVDESRNPACQLFLGR